MRKKQSAKDIAEKARLIELSRALGQEPDPKLVSEVQKHLDFQSSLRQSIRSSLVQDLQKAITTTKQELDVALVQAEVVEPQAEFVALPPSLDDLEKLLGFSIDSIPDPVVQTVTAEPVAEIVQVEAEPEPESEAVVEQSLADLVSKSITDIVQKTPYDLPGTKKANSEVDAEVIRNADVQSLKRKLEELTRHLDRVNAKVDHAGGGGIDWVLTKLNNTAIGASTIFNFEGNGFQLDYDARINQSNIKMLGLDFFIWRYTISTVTDTVSGIDDFGATLTYVPGQISVYINGVMTGSGIDGWNEHWARVWGIDGGGRIGERERDGELRVEGTSGDGAVGCSAVGGECERRGEWEGVPLGDLWVEQCERGFGECARWGRVWNGWCDGEQHGVDGRVFG